MSSFRTRSPASVTVAATLLATLILAAPLAASPADARAGGGFSFGSRGSRTFSMPAPTPTAPRAQSFQRTDAPYGAGVAAQPRRFGLGTGLLAGLLGAGLMGSLFGGGFFSGIAALIGLLFKLALIGGVIWLVLRLFRGRSPLSATAGGSGPSARRAFGGLPGAAPATPAATRAASVTPSDYAAFESTLTTVQEAYSREDANALARLATPEVVRNLLADIEANRRQGVRNDVSRVKLLQGDLSEAWSEGSATYATVAMRFAAVDVMLERASGRIVSGDAVHPAEAVELWTFRRDGRGPWALSGIQQAS